MMQGFYGNSIPGLNMDLEKQKIKFTIASYRSIKI